jgi:hypothetical protein
MTTYPPTPFPWKGVITVRGFRPLRSNESLPPWGGPAEAA